MINMLTKNKSRREFNWLPSSEASSGALAELEKQMSALYASEKVRELYETICFAARDSQPAVTRALIDAVVKAAPQSVLEVGCGSAWLAKRMFDQGLSEVAYHGVEMEAGLIAENAKKLSHAHFTVGSVYELPFEAGSFHAVFAYFVLEHCVYPERALTEMMRVLKPGGMLLLVFPDFVSLRILPSQSLGLREGNAKELLKKGRFLSAVIALYDSRIRLRRALRDLVKDYGPFPVNVTPRCLRDGKIVSPDTDAVYIATKSEVFDWARAQGYGASFPCGGTGAFHATAFVKVIKAATAG